MISGNRLPEIIRTIGIFRAIMLLRVIPGARKIVVRQRWNKLVAEDCLYGRPRHIILAAVRMMRAATGNAGLKVSGALGV